MRSADNVDGQTADMPYGGTSAPPADLADQLVRRGVRFAQAHEQVGMLVLLPVLRWPRNWTFAGLSAAEAQRFIPSWDAKLRQVAVSPESAISRRNVVGGTAPRQVARQIALAEGALRKLKKRTAQRRQPLGGADVAHLGMSAIH